MPETATDRPAPSARNPERPRWLPLDLARGAAVVAMVVYHTAWDLSALRLIVTEVTESPGWSLFARAIAASFLLISGFALTLAHSGGRRASAFARRLAVVAAAAALVSAATYLAFPDSWIFFGILHNIAFSSVLALPFLRAPAAASAAAALAFWAAPLVAGRLGRPDLLEAPSLAFLGLGARPPLTNDFVPVFPWTGFVLMGVAAGRTLGPRLAPVRPARASGPVRLLAAIGRRSLLIYLLHQPLIYGALSGAAEVLGANPAAEAARYLSRCERSCRGQAQSAERCAAYCPCNLDGVRAAGLWPDIARGAPRPDQLPALGEIARACARAHP